jgi:hypothetical protein
VSYPLANVGFELHTFLLGSAIPPFQPATPCGLDILSRSNVTGESFLHCNSKGEKHNLLKHKLAFFYLVVPHFLLDVGLKVFFLFLLDQ